MDDYRIIRRVQEGDAEAFAVLVRKYHRHLLAFIFRLVRDRHLAEDIGQEAFLDVYKSLSRFEQDRGTPFVAWLYVAARNRCVSEIRRRGRMDVVPAEDFLHVAAAGDTAEAALLRQEERQALQSSLAQLPEPFRSTIMMSLQGDSLDAIAFRCGIPRATVKTRLFRARERLKQYLRQYFGGVGHERQI
jgi:RNA polymerase sigma-70 factor (ECF subfamily)